MLSCELLKCQYALQLWQLSVNMNSMKIYLDVCCLNRPFDDQTQDRIHLEAEAILAVLNYSRMSGWSVIGSDAIDFEIGRMPDHDKRLKVQILSTLHDVYVKVDAGVERRSMELKQVGLKALDALHVSCAERAKAEVFLTTDDHLLSKAVQNKKILKVRIENPLRWVTEVLK
jgi:predicted nucleic acid-binding protein